MKIIYLAHPIASDEQFTTDDNIKHLLMILWHLNFRGENEEKIVPMAPYLGDVMSMKDDNPLHRKRGIENDIAIIESGIFEEIWLTGHKLSLGMAEEVKLFVLQGKKVVDLIGKI